MLRLRNLALPTLAISLLLFPHQSHAVTCGSWNEAEKSIRAWWSKAYSQEKILSIEQNGPAQTYSKMQSTNQRKIDEYGNEWEYYKKNPYCSIPAKVRVQQSSGPRIFSVSAVFKVNGKKFTFDDVAVGGSEAAAQAGEAAAPDKDEIKNVITETYLANIPNNLKSAIKVDKVMIAPRKLDRWGEGQSGYSMSTIDLYLIIDGEKQDKCEMSLVTLYKGEEKNQRLNAPGPWKINFGIKNDISRCAGKYWSQVHDFVNGVAPQAAPVIDSSWFKKVAGTYSGDIQTERYNVVTTVLSVDANGAMSGSFSYKEGNKPVSGTLSDCKATRATWAQCAWHDSDNDKGSVEFQFQKDLKSFVGSWWKGTTKKRDGSWDGKKTSNATASVGAASSGGKEGSASSPGFNKMFKGLGF